MNIFKTIHKIIRHCAMLCCAIFYINSSVVADVVLYDPEIQDFFSDVVYKLCDVAHINREHIRVYILVSDMVNAFTTGVGVFIYSGIIQHFSDASSLIGVIGHEVGHIAKRDVIVLTEQLSQGLTPWLASSVLVGAMGAAISSALLPVAIIPTLVFGGSMLENSRNIEAATDIKGVDLLMKAKMPIHGLYHSMHLFHDLDTNKRDMPEWTRTHPLSSNRMTNLKRCMEKYSNYSYDKEYMRHADFAYAMIRSKLSALSGSNYYLNLHISDNPTSDKEKYRAAIVALQKSDLDRAMRLINVLILEHPDYIYFLYTKGQILERMGKFDDAIRLYNKVLNDAIKNKKDVMVVASIQFDIGRLKMTIKQYDEAIQLLIQVKKYIQASVVFDSLTFCYQSVGHDFMAKVSNIEKFIVLGMHDHARKAIISALKYARSHHEKVMLQNLRVRAKS